jgi:poly(3-hydroxyalkanoate) synthetase
MTMDGACVAPEAFERREARLRRIGKLLTTKAAIAQTPKEQIWSLNKTRLYRYVPVVPEGERYPVPLLLVFALMNRPYIFDLRPDHSFVEFMVAQGYDVYLLDWVRQVRKTAASSLTTTRSIICRAPFEK